MRGDLHQVGSLRRLLERQPIRASAPCRVDMGGTLDLSTFYYPMHDAGPLTVNIAVALRTRIELLPHREGRILVESPGVGRKDFAAHDLPFEHPLGLMLFIAARFAASGLCIRIESDSPPRSGLGGSSVAAVALVAALAHAFERLGRRPLRRKETALLAHGVEGAVAGVPCGMQDQLAAAYGGVHAWFWPGDPRRSPFTRKVLVPASGHARLQRHLLLAYCGVPHESRTVNRRWVQRFLQGMDRQVWEEILDCTRRFAESLACGDFTGAAACMDRETELRCEMTPEVLTETGRGLVTAARQEGGAARFTGAGAGGCIWAIGSESSIHGIRRRWEELLAGQTEARLLPFTVDRRGVHAEVGESGSATARPRSAFSKE